MQRCRFLYAGKHIDISLHMDYEYLKDLRRVVKVILEVIQEFFAKCLQGLTTKMFQMKRIFRTFLL